MRLLNEQEKAFISLVRLGIGRESTFQINNANWTSIEALAIRQGLTAVVMDGIE